MNVLYLVIPCYNEEEVLPESAERLEAEMEALIARNRISPLSRILFVNDGSTDHTWQLIRVFHENNPLISGVSLSRNRGHQNALLAGLSVAVNYADLMITMDADLQDDLRALDDMLSKYQEGFEIVYGVRSSRKKDSIFKRFSAEAYYKFLRLLGVDIIYNHADFRLMSRKAVKGLMEFQEVHLFLRGIVPLVGYRWTTVAYERSERRAGKSKYTARKMIELAVEGITSFSTKPLKLISRLGAVTCLVSAAMLVWSAVQHFFDRTAAGWPSLMVSVWFIGGLQMVCLGITGEYIGKIYGEVKRRPRFLIESVLNDGAEDMEKGVTGDEGQ